MAYNTAPFNALKYKNIAEAKKYFILANEILPKDDSSKWGLANYYYVKKDCTKSEKILKDLIESDGFNKSPCVYLYKVYKSCFKDDEKARQIKKTYEKTFKGIFNGKLLEEL